jgi:hypothetical protein
MVMSKSTTPRLHVLYVPHEPFYNLLGLREPLRLNIGGYVKLHFLTGDSANIVVDAGR